MHTRAHTHIHTHTPPDDLLHVLPPSGTVYKVGYVQFKLGRRSNHPVTHIMGALLGREASSHDNNTGAQQLEIEHQKEHGAAHPMVIVISPRCR